MQNQTIKRSMIITKCPLRISLVGGSTDTPMFLNTYQRGSVISFPCDLHTYIMLNDVSGTKYRISYSSVEETSNVNSIKNDIAREVIKYFGLPPVEITFNSDIPNTGTGLATSSSYLISLIKAVDIYFDLNMSQFEICRLAYRIERNINPHTGLQDIFGCGIGCFKRIDFVKDKNPSFIYLDTELITSLDLFLVSTGLQRSSTEVLQTLDVAKCQKLLKYVDELENSIRHGNSYKFFHTITKNWNQKKLTSKSNLICNEKILNMENEFSKNINIKSWKLLGAGRGGYFLILAQNLTGYGIRVGIDNVGVTTLS